MWVRNNNNNNNNNNLKFWYEFLTYLLQCIRRSTWDKKKAYNCFCNKSIKCNLKTRTQKVRVTARHRRTFVGYTHTHTWREALPSNLRGVVVLYWRARPQSMGFRPASPLAFSPKTKGNIQPPRELGEAVIKTYCVCHFFYCFLLTKKAVFRRNKSTAVEKKKRKKEKRRQRVRNLTWSPSCFTQDEMEGAARVPSPVTARAISRRLCMTSCPPQNTIGNEPEDDLALGLSLQTNVWDPW